MATGSATRIAKIVKSNSHIDYVGRVVDRLDANEPPTRGDYCFAQFVTLPVDGIETVGIIYDTQLANPEYANFGPRLSPAVELAVLSPDFLNEQGVLIGILLLGWQAENAVHHGVPREVIPAGADVYRMSTDDVLRFHQGHQWHQGHQGHQGHQSADAGLRLHYFSQIIAHGGNFAVPLVEAIVAQLEIVCTPQERQRLCVLKKSLVWQRTLGSVRL